MHLAHFNVPAHFGIRTERYKLIHYPADPPAAAGAIQERHLPAWEFFDLQNDPQEMRNLFGVAEYNPVISALQQDLATLRHALGDEN
jgi:hypothetical protein